jgi:hypothetical protein
LDLFETDSKLPVELARSCPRNALEKPQPGFSRIVVPDWTSEQAE